MSTEETEIKITADLIKKHLTEIDVVKTYMVIDFGYDMSICLPYIDGATIITKLEKAEKVETDRYGNKTIKFKPELPQFTFRVISQKEYREQKMQLLLGI